MKWTDQIYPIWSTREKKLWRYAMLYFCVFPLIALWDLPLGIRPWFLTVGFCVGVFGAFGVLVCEARKDLLLLGLSVTVLLYWLFAFPAAINSNDDNNAYLIFAKDFYIDIARTIQPLSERRLFSIGGNYAFQAPVLHWVGIRGLSLVEPTLGLLLIYVIMFGASCRRSLVLCCVSACLLALLPTGGSKVLANTASVFVLSAFTFALLELGRSLLDDRKIDWTDLLLLVVLPLAASTFRPITMPFNIGVSCLIAILIVIKHGETKRLAASLLLIFPIFYLALLPYHQVGQTYLFPLLGSGEHISASGHSIAASILWTQHLKQFATIAMTDPFFLLNLGLSCVLLFGRSDRLRGAAALLVTGGYVVFYLLIVVSTGGLASARYVFPVSLALLLSFTFECFGSQPISDNFSRAIGSRFRALRGLLPMIRVVSVLGTVSLLVLVKLVVGPSVIQKRYETYSPNAEISSEIVSVATLANRARAHPGATLLVGTGYDRFIVDRLSGNYFTMDQPGMMSPGLGQGLNYETGLKQFIEAHQIDTIILTHLDCDAIGASQASGWSGLMDFGRNRNEEALCSLLSSYNVQIFGSFKVLFADLG